MKLCEALPVAITALALSCSNPRPVRNIRETTQKTVAAVLVLPAEDPVILQEKQDLGLPEESTLEDISRAFLDKQEDEKEAEIQDERERAGGRLGQLIIKWIKYKLENTLDKEEDPPQLSPDEIEIAHSVGWGVDINEHMEVWSNIARQVGLPENAEWGDILNQYAFSVDNGLFLH